MRTRRRATGAAMAVLLLAAAGCGEVDDGGHAAPEPTPDVTVPDPDQSRETVTAGPVLADPAGVPRLATATNAFGFDLLAGLGAEADDPNVVVSPPSVAVVLALLANGAVGASRDEIESALGVAGWDETERNGATRALLDALADGDDVDLRIASSLWADDDFTVDDAYIDRAGAAFDAAVAELDLAARSSVDRIDGWVADHTDGLVGPIAENLGLPDPEAALVLLNAVYFKGEWTVPFDPGMTSDDEFTRADGSTVTVPFMRHRDTSFPYASTDTLSAVRLPYGDDERMAMHVVVPQPGRSVDEVLASLDDATWASLLAGMEPRNLDVLIPRLEVEWDGGLDRVLQGLGIASVYDGGLDRIGPGELFLSGVVHATYLRVDEEGTEAAAVTGGMVGVTSLPDDPTVFRADRPYLVMITDAETDAILFLGAIGDPSV